MNKIELNTNQLNLLFMCINDCIMNEKSYIIIDELESLLDYIKESVNSENL